MDVAAASLRRGGKWDCLKIDKQPHFLIRQFKSGFCDLWWCSDPVQDSSYCTMDGDSLHQSVFRIANIA